MSRSNHTNQFDPEHNLGEEGFYHDLLLDQPGNPDHVIPPWEAKIAEGDHLRIDEQGYDEEEEEQ